MPLFTRELNEQADYIGRADLTIRLHTATPSNANAANGRTTVGGGAFEAGKVLAASNITNAVNGDIRNSVAIDFGTADEAVGTVTHWTAARGADPVAFGTLPNTAIANGGSFQIDANSLNFNGSTS